MIALIYFNSFFIIPLLSFYFMLLSYSIKHLTIPFKITTPKQTNPDCIDINKYPLDIKRIKSLKKFFESSYNDTHMKRYILILAEDIINSEDAIVLKQN